jgi:hypothetical protein
MTVRVAAQHNSSRPAGRIDWTAWGVAVLAMCPMVLAYALHYLCVPPGYTATGFLQPDLPSYMADARAFFFNGFSLTYGLPFSPNDTTPRIYFQPLMLLMGVAQKLTGFAPGTIFVATGVASGIVMFRVAIAMEMTFYGRPGDRAAWLAVIALLWGGGIVVIVSLGLFWLSPLQPRDWFLHALFAADAGDGSWFLNLGRNVYFANEAFYHVVFLSAITLVAARRYMLATAFLAVMAASHPVTGIELLLIVGAFSAVEFTFQRPVAPPLWFAAVVGALTVLHVFYYIVALPLLSEEHRQVEKQWDMPWTLTTTNIIAAYLPVMILTVVHLLRRHRWRMDLSQANVRFLLVWFAVAFILANHELFMNPREPVHFTRGYIWTPLALLSLPVVDSALATTLAIRGSVRRSTCVVMLLGLILFDNIIWFGREYFLMVRGGDHIQQYIRNDAKAAIDRLGQADMRGRLLLSNDQQLGYLAIVYQPLRTWMSHGNLTPEAERRQAELARFFATGEEVDSWRARALVVVVDTQPDLAVISRLIAAGFTPVASYGRYEVLTRSAAGQS